VFLYKALFHVLAAHKLEQEQKLDEARGGGVREEMLQNRCSTVVLYKNIIM